jgi:hypothetical protein
MPTRQFDESEALRDAETEAFKHLEIDPADRESLLLSHILPGSLDQLNDLVVSLLTQPEMMHGCLLEHRKDYEPPTQPTGYGSRLRSQIEGAHTVRVDFFRFNVCWEKTATSLFSLAIALCTLKADGFAVPALETVLGAWRSWIALKSPDDDLAIKAYEALLRTQWIALRKERRNTPPPFAQTRVDPTLEQIHAHADGLSQTDVIVGLKKLRTLRLVDITIRNSDNDQDPENCWYQLI